MATLRAAMLALTFPLLLGAEGALAVEWKGGAPPPGFTKLEVLGVIPTEEGNTVILLDQAQERFLPMGVGLTEALAIHIRLERQQFARPLTHDLMDTVLKQLGARVVRVQIDDYRDDTFLATLFVEQGGKVLRFDARPSDVIALALGSQVPVYIRESLMKEHAVNIADLEDAPPELKGMTDEEEPIVKL